MVDTDSFYGENADAVDTSATTEDEEEVCDSKIKEIERWQEIRVEGAVNGLCVAFQKSCGVRFGIIVSVGMIFLLFWVMQSGEKGSKLHIQAPKIRGISDLYKIHLPRTLWYNFFGPS